MRVAIVTAVYPPYRSGMSIVPYEEAQLLKEKGVDVQVLTPAYGPGTAGNQEGVERIRPLLTVGNAAVLPGIAHRLFGASVVHLHYPFFGTDVLTVLAALVQRRPLFVTYHMRAEASGVKGMIFTVYRLLFERWILRSARRVFVSSLDYARANGVRRPDCVALPFSVDTDRFAPGDKAAARREFGLPEEGPVVVFVGAMDEQHRFKGVYELLVALARVPALHLLLVGDGGLRREYEEAAQRLGVGHRVRFAGRVSEEKKPMAYQAADMHVLPSTTRAEAFGIVTLEAMASGIPSVVSDLPGVRTLVHGGETGRVVPVGDTGALAAALQTLSSDHALRAQLGARAREIACARYTPKTVQETLYRELSLAAQSQQV